MKDTRYEIEITTCKDGTLFARIFDEYWDSHTCAVFDRAAGVFKPARYETDPPEWVREVTAPLSNPQPGCWYAVTVDNYPFGKVTGAYRIPGRHLRYRKAAH